MKKQFQTIEEIIGGFQPGTPQRERLEYEWEIICKTGNEEYFRAWNTEINRAQSQEFPVTGFVGGNYCLFNRFYIGGAPNCSYLLYCAHVTKVDALKMNLPFERFINPMQNALSKQPTVPRLPVFFMGKDAEETLSELPAAEEALLSLLIERGELDADFLAPTKIIQSHYSQQPVENVLSATNGRLVWQEQFLHLLHAICGYSYAEADCMRMDVAKKIPSGIALLQENFVEGAVQLGYEEADAQELVNELIARNNFCPLKAHKLAILLNT